MCILWTARGNCMPLCCIIIDTLALVHELEAYVTANDLHSLRQQQKK